MKTKKAKAAKLGKKNRGISDVSPSTSLPPLVEGQVQCFLRIAVSKILWIVPRPPASPLVRLRWWGETSNGTQFRPRDASHAEQKSAKTIARYAVRCGPKQFTSYLTDMGTLVLEVMTKPDHLPIGRVQINGISQLSPTYGISGFFTVISPTSEKLGELQVSLALESLSESCDSSSSIPNTDASVDGAVSAQSSAVLLTSRTGSFENLIEFSAPRKSSITSASGKESLSSSTCNTPRGRDHVYFQENAKITKTVSSEKKQPLSSAPYVPAETLEAAGERIEARVLSTDSQTTKNLISVLLDRGSKLRNAMVISAMKTVPNGMSGLVDSPYMVPCEDIGMSKSKKLPSHSGKLLHNLLESEDTCPTNDSLQFSPGPLKEVHPNTDATAIGLLLGSTDSIPLHYWDGMGSPPESPSAGSSVLDESELNDPHYDQSLLEHLFYKDPKYESSGSEFTSDDEELDISKKKLRQQSHHKADIRNQQGLSHLASDCSIIDLTQNEAVKTIGSYPVLEGPPLAEQEMQAIELSVDRLTLLGRIYLARVIIETLKLPPDSAQTTPKQKGSRGKPPRPVPGRKCTYFVEYHFPVATPSRGAARGVSMTSEITRVASSKVTSEAVKFQQRFVFPICFNGLMIERWWNSDLLFKIYSRKSTQKKPILIGTASLALRSIIQSDLLNITSELPVEMVCDNKEKQKQIGPLKVSVELAADNKDLTSANARLAASPKATYVVSSPRANLASEPKGVDVCPMDLHPVGPHAPDSSSKRNKPQLKQSHVQDMLRNDHSEHSYPSSVPGGQHLFRQFSSSVEDEEGFLLHVLLMVPDGKDFVMGDGTIQQQHSIYLKCKLFSTDEATRSPVSWSTSRPIFNFSLVAPITLTPRLLERMKNNMMIIEIWNKVSNTGQEKLLGLVKLPLHQFYLSFRDPKISHLLFQAQYPVVAVDSYMPMMDVFTGCQRGSLRVLLAMGEANQIVELQRLKNEAGTAVSVFQRTPHFLEQVASVPSKLGREETESLMEHIFEINVVQLKGLTPLQSTVWGEADCYIQYYFPTLEADTITETLPIVNDIILKPFRTATTLCVPDPLFNDCRSHSLLIPPDLPVQRILLNACSKQKSTGGGGLQFEVWCRYYYPNVRDQVVARGVLPLSKLCAMVTMQHHKEVGVQTFGIPLMPRIENEGHAACSAGLLDVSVRYRCSVQSTEDAGNGVIASRAVSLSVQLLRASGLQAAARAAAERSHSLKYQSEIGVNTYITIHISFLENEKRRTKVVARTFCPEFDHYSEFPCNILIQRSTGESFSLAELLESSEAVFTIYHQSTTPAKPSTILIGASRDVVLGTVRIPLASLLTRRTGISGWYAVSLPEIPASAQSCGALQNLGGGLEISIHFAHPNDRERVVKAAETLGWKYGTSGEEGKEGQSPESSISITLTVSRIWLPLHSVVLAGRAHLDKSTFCYLRYKLYDREAICTSLQKPVLTVNESYATVNFDQATTIYLKRTQSLIWYLKEERLEVQAWLAFGKDNKTLRPCDTDRLIGYSFIDLSTLAEKPLRKLTVSGVYPLFKRGASDLSGAALRFHITLAPHDRLSSTGDYTSPRICDVEDDHDYAHDTKENVPSINEKEQMSDGHIVKEMSTGFNIECQKVVNEISEVDLANTFAVNVVVERAMHLSLKGCPLTEQTIVKPSCYVSYATPVSPTPITTQLIENAYSPVWDHQQQTRLPKELLLDPQQTLVFKVWHKADIDRVIGFATVDLSALLSGFLTICGWYNITDFSGQCQGQLKVAITPLENIHHLREKRSTQTHKQVAGSASILESLSYRTSGMYNSFPSHISKYSEQFITSLNADATSANDRSANTEIQTSRHEEHMKNIRRFHQSLQNTGFSESLSQTSRTSLFSALRRNLSELDDIQRYFSQKLSTSPFSQMVNPTPAQRADENTMNYHHRSSSSGDEQRLLEKSKKLVSETRHFINGLQESTKADVTSPTQSSRATEDWVKIAENEPQRLENERNKSQCEVFPYVQSPERENLKTQICIQGNSELGHIKLDEYFDQEQISSQNNRSNVENGNHQNDDSSEEGYEEDVIQPRILNDMTVMTDRTSPWSSILSEFEDNYKHECEGTRETHEPIGNGIQAEEKQAIPVYVHDELFTKRVQNKNCHLPGNIATGESPPSARFSLVNEGINLDIPDTNLILQSEQYSEIELLEIQSSDDRDLFSSNPDEAEDLIQENGDVTECNIFPSGEFPLADREKGGLKVNSNHEDYRHNNTNREIEIQELFKRQNHEGPQFSEAGGECVQRRCEESSDTDSSEDTHSVRLSDPVVIPNFFLPPSHLEASMRVLNVAQSIHRAATNHSEVSSLIRTRRSNRQKPRLALTELPKEETERIAKIFAGRFVEKS